jgi:hypothetical protein
MDNLEAVRTLLTIVSWLLFAYFLVSSKRAWQENRGVRTRVRPDVKQMP